MKRYRTAAQPLGIIFGLSLAILGVVTFWWPLLYARWVRRHTPEQRWAKKRRWGVHFEMVKPEVWYFYLFGYEEILVIAVAGLLRALIPGAPAVMVTITNAPAPCGC